MTYLYALLLIFVVGCSDQEFESGAIKVQSERTETETGSPSDMDILTNGTVTTEGDESSGSSLELGQITTAG